MPKTPKPDLPPTAPPGQPQPDLPHPPPPTPAPDLPPAAQRALAEADARRKDSYADAAMPKELGGRDGPEAVRYGDWEKKGIAVDF